MNVADKMAFGTFFPLDELSKTDGLSDEFFHAIYALPFEEVEFQDLFLSRILDSVCKHLLPSMLPASPEAAAVSFSYREDIDWPHRRYRPKVSSTLVASIQVCTSADGSPEDLIVSTAFAGCQFRDPDRNKLAAKYLMLKSLFQAKHRQTSLDFGMPMTIKRSCMAETSILSATISIHPQRTIEDIITSFFIDQIPFEGFPEA